MRPATTVSRRIRRFLADRRGGMAVWFALALVPLLAFAGTGVDIARSVNQQSQIQGAVDAAALAGASAYVSVGTAVTATAVSTNYMQQFITSSGLSGLTYTVTPVTVTVGSSITLFKVTVTATTPIDNTLMKMFKSGNTLAVKATAQNPVYNITISAGNFNSSAADLNTISYYVVPNDNSLPVAPILLFTNDPSVPAVTGSVMIQVTASQKIGFMLTNTTGGRPVTTTTTQQSCGYVWVLFLYVYRCTPVTVTTTSTTSYTNQYGGTAGSTHLFYSHIFPPSKIAYPSVTQNCSLIVQTTSAAPPTGSCSSSLSANSAVNCVQASGQTLYFDWNDMGGGTDDKDYNDATYSVTCSKVDNTIGKGLVLTD